MIAYRKPYALFNGLWWLTGMVLFVLSAETAWFARGSNNHNVHALIVGSIEAVGAVLFLIPRTLGIGSTLLLIALSIAFVVHAAAGQFRADLLVYGAVVGFVAINALAASPSKRV
jgi:hypothetical protein